MEKSQSKLMAWTAYVLLMLCGNVVSMDFLLALVTQSCEACRQRVQSQSLKAQAFMIRDNYLALPEEACDGSSVIVIFKY